ncbi:MAG TPA: cation-transporting P-type ATPase, partial [Gaiellaceae bacterium]|nr:cation-transporting P-type ATPase [Gaiellaceae bacterium]
ADAGLMVERAPHAATVAAVAASLATDPERGLSLPEAAARLARDGLNRPRPMRRPPYARLALGQLLDPLVALLVVVAAISIAIGDIIEGAAIGSIVVVNGLLGFWQEAGAERAIRALSEAFTRSALVVRDGVERTVAAEDVVAGDVLVLGEGDRVAADARLVAGRALEVDESALTGESLPVAKQVHPVASTAPLAERSSMLHAGTGVTRGRGRGIVCATGAQTELGRIEVLASAATPPPTPLTLRLGRLARQMAVAGVGITVVLGSIMLLRGERPHVAFLTAVAVAVAAVPEGLAATVTASLALGTRAMARRGVIVRRLAAIETLGETSVICTDKTGTLTENRIRVAGLLPASGFDERALLEAAVLASTARTVGDEVVGDPIETALLLAALERGLSHEELAAGRELLYELPFDSDRKRMTLVWADRDRRLAYTKGAPEVVAGLADARDHPLLDAAGSWAAEGFRVLAVAARPLDPATALDESVETAGKVVGVVALHDPLRETSADAVAAAARAGIAVRMITGDHPATARTIGHAVGLRDDAILARATPADKLALVVQLQEEGEIVAVTGDGVNDAPALRGADVGIAMGRSGTEAAREAASIVLTNDDFAAIVAAVAEGRRIGDNIRKFVAFLLSANLGEVFAFAIAVGAGFGAPLSVVQVLVVNLVTDGLPAVALAQDPADSSTMRSPPRRTAHLFGRRRWSSLALIGLAVGGVTLGSFEIGKVLGGDAAQTMAFTTLALSELALVFAMRSTVTAAWRLTVNAWLIRSVAISVAVVAAAVYLPVVHEALSTVSLGPWAALVAFALALVPFALLEAAKAARRRPRPERAGVSLHQGPLHRPGPPALSRGERRRP